MHEEVVARLRHKLVEGEIPPGARVPERELCEALGISRTPLREALKVLAAEGLVVLLPNRGARAARLTRENVQDLFEVCEGLEALAGELACQRISDQQVAEIAALHAAMLTHFRAGELISYYGWNDAMGGGRENLDYYEMVERVMGGPESTRNFYRLFMIPGMNHCAGGDGVSMFDYIGALDRWVEQGKAPVVVRFRQVGLQLERPGISAQRRFESVLSYEDIAQVVMSGGQVRL